MIEIPVLQVEDIAELVGTRNLRHGRDYYHSGAILDPSQQGMILKASCLGSRSEPYQISVEFDERGVRKSSCTCPIGRHGNCKHVAALLICWQERPELFADFEPWDKALGKCSRRQLIETIKELLQYRPELQRMTAELLRSEELPEKEIDAAGYRQRVAEVLRSPSDTPESAARLVDRLLEIKDAGDTLSGRHEDAGAAAIYRLLVAELLARPDLLTPRYPPLRDLLGECVETLHGCLPLLEHEPQSRLEILHALVEFHRFELVQGGISPGIDVARMIAGSATAEERAAVSGWIRDLLPAIDGRQARRSLGGLLLELAGASLAEAEFFEVCRRSGRIFDLVRQLVYLGRMEQALAESAAADDEELLAIADLLVGYRHEQAAEGLVRQRAERSPQPPLEQWLARRLQQQRQQQAVLELTEKVFRLRPGFAVYKRLRKLARQFGRWDALHADLLDVLQQQGHLPLLTRIHLEENNLDRALHAVGADGGPLADVRLAVRVARAAEASRPSEALRMYRAAAEHLIERRGRANYAEACRCLRRARPLAERSGDLSQWNAYLDQLQQQHRPLQGLCKELESLKG